MIVWGVESNSLMEDWKESTTIGVSFIDITRNLFLSLE